MNFQGAKVSSVNAIEDLAGEIQNLPAAIRWLYTNEDVIRATACNSPVERGPRMRLLKRFLLCASFAGLANAAARFASLCFLMASYLTQFRSARRARPSEPLFVGVGSLRESALVKELSHDRCKDPFLLNESLITTFLGAQRLSIAELLSEWIEVARSASDHLTSGRGVGVSVAERRIEFAAGAHRYAVFRAWFRKVLRRLRADDLITFSTPGPAAFGAISVGARAAYYLHGFQRQSLVYPDFEEVRCFTHIEAGHIARRLPTARVRICEEVGELIATERGVAIAGCYGQTMGFDGCAEFITWAERNGIPIVIRPHPLDRSGFFARWRADSHVSFSETSSSFDEFLEQYRPRLLLSWYSTALFDALRRGVVPITVETESWRTLDTVFPFQAISLKWPQDRQSVDKFMCQDEERLAFLSDRRALASIESRSS